MGVRRAVDSYCWVKKPICHADFEIQLLRMCDYSPYRCIHGASTLT